MRARAWTVAAVMSVATLAHADDVVPVGSRVRVAGVARGSEAPGARDGLLVGEVAATDGSVLTVRRDDGERFTIRWDEVDRLDVSRGRRSRGGGGLRGAGRGALVGSAISLALVAAAGRSGGVDGGYEAALGALLAPAAGATVGLVAGLVSPGERWARVDVGRSRIRIGLTTGPRGRGAGLAVSVGF